MAEPIGAWGGSCPRENVKKKKSSFVAMRIFPLKPCESLTIWLKSNMKSKLEKKYIHMLALLKQNVGSATA